MVKIDWINRLGEERLNRYGYLMRIVEYNGVKDVVVEFQDKYKARVHTRYEHFINNSVRNPYHNYKDKEDVDNNTTKKTIINVDYKAIIKRESEIRERTSNKEYETWKRMLMRSFDERYKERKPTYKDVTCCEDWLCYGNFYEWLHDQDNFNKWVNGKWWAIDKDILVKGNKVYSPETCCLVPVNVNNLFRKSKKLLEDVPIGVEMSCGRYRANCSNGIKNIYLGTFGTKEEAFQVYKKCKEEIIKQIAQEEYANGNITKRCYEAMMNYEVEITD